MSTIFSIGIVISLCQFFLLLNKKGKTVADKILTFWMLIIGFHLFNYNLNYLGYWESIPHLIGIAAPIPLIYGPLLFLYVVHSLKNKQQFGRNDYWHFAPVLISYLYMCKFFFFYTADEKIKVDTGQIEDFSLFATGLLIAFVISSVIYSVLAFRLLNTYQALLDRNFSHEDGINLRWLKGLIVGIGLVFLTVILVLVARDILGFAFPFDLDYIFYSMLVLAILVLGYFGIRHENIFRDNEILEAPLSPSANYEKSGLDVKLAGQKHRELLALMENEKIFLEPKLSLSRLAEELQVSTNHLSQIINQFEEQNFNDFVNSYRVEEFILKASQFEHLSYLALALDAGFNSKSTFNTVFKKHKGVSPSQFLSNSKSYKTS